MAEENNGISLDFMNEDEEEDELPVLKDNHESVE